MSITVANAITVKILYGAAIKLPIVALNAGVPMSAIIGLRYANAAQQYILTAVIPWTAKNVRQSMSVSRT